MTSGVYIRVKARYEYKKLRCKGCGIDFASKSRNKMQRFCGHSCAGKHIRNSGQISKGSVAWNKGVSGERSHIFGRVLSEFTKTKIRDSHKIRYVGKILKTPQNELLRKGQEYRKWRSAVFKRDNWTCQECGDRSRQGNRLVIHAHHIKLLSKFPSLACTVSNGVTLCADCHQKKHKKEKLTGLTAEKL